MITPLQQDARRYLRSWVTIAAAWVIATAVVVVWSIGGHSSSPPADPATLSAPSGPPQPVTVTAQPTAPVPTFGDPAPTRWPPPPSNAAASPIWMGITGTGPDGTLLIDQGSPKLGVPAGKACDTDMVKGSTGGGNVYVALIDSTAWVFCFSSGDAQQIKQACSDSPNSAGGGLCALVAVGDGYYRAGTFTPDCLPATADPAAVAGRTYPRGCVQGA